LVSVLFGVSVSVVNNNSLSFFILWWHNFKNLVVRWIHKEFTLQLEYLEPSRVSAPNLHVSGFSSTLDVPWLIVQSSLDGLWGLIEVPGLCLSSVWRFDDHISIVDQIKVSTTR
jgi:hypothetical protein